VGFGIEASIMFLYWSVLLGFIQLLFCDDLHRTWCIVLVYQKVLQCFGVIFWSSVKLLVLGSNLWLVLGSSVPGIWGFCCMNLLTKLCSGSLSLCLQLKRYDGFADVSWNTWNTWMNFILRSIQLQIECGGSREYQLRIGPSQAMIKDLAVQHHLLMLNLQLFHSSWRTI
jgi:hypothetical protein